MNTQRFPLVQVIEPRSSVRGWLAEMWRYRGVLWALCAREIRGKYKQAVLGVAWAFIQPVVQVCVFTFVFRTIVRVDTPIAYPVFALAALLPFNLFQQIVSLGTPAFVSQQHLVTKVYFPRIYTVLASSAPPLLNATISAVALVVAMVAFAVRPSAQLFLVIPLIGSVVLLSVGLACLFGAINARFRDVQHGIPLIMTVLLYITPVLYPIQSVPATIRPIALANPLTGLIEGMRVSVSGVSPESWTAIWLSMVASILVFGFGVWVFERNQASLIDVL